MNDHLAERLAAALGSAYEAARCWGRGGMGAVYRATDRRLRREVAVKVLPPELGYSEDLRARCDVTALRPSPIASPPRGPSLRWTASGGKRSNRGPGACPRAFLLGRPDVPPLGRPPPHCHSARKSASV